MSKTATWESDGPEGDNPMPLLEHLVELRRRIIYSAIAFSVGFSLAFYFAQPILDYLMAPLADAMKAYCGTTEFSEALVNTREDIDAAAAQEAAAQCDMRVIYTHLLEAFLTHIKVAAFGGLCLGFPLIAAQFWLFVAPGLYKHEKSVLAPFLVTSPILFLMGGALVYYFVIPMAWLFLLGFQTTQGEGALPIEVLPKVGEYLSLVMRMIFAFGLSFQLPILLTLLARMGVVDSHDLVARRKYAIIGVFVFAAIITPPDVLSQIGLGVPMLLLYEISIWIARLVEKRRAEEEAELDRDLAGETAGGAAGQTAPPDVLDETDFNTPAR